MKQLFSIHFFYEEETLLIDILKQDFKDFLTDYINKYIENGERK